MFPRAALADLQRTVEDAPYLPRQKLWGRIPYLELMQKRKREKYCTEVTLQQITSTIQ